MTKNWYQSKTVWFNVLGFVVAIAAAFGFTGEISAELGTFVLPAVTVINLILRFVTSKGIA